MRESEIQSKIRDGLCRGAVRLWRNNVGTGLMVAHAHSFTKQAIVTKCIDLAGKLGGHAQRLKFGLTEGSGDLIGYRQVTVTPEMVGRTVAVILSVEVKTGTGRVAPQQQAWLDHINSVGGIAIIARSLEDAQNGVDAPFSGVPCSSSTREEA